MNIHKDGGNNFDKMYIDYDLAFEKVSMLEGKKEKINRSWLKNYLHRLHDEFLLKVHLVEPLVIVGMRKKWFDEFCLFWREFLNGRPLSIVDFHALRIIYRLKAQHMEEFDWSDKQQHELNWKMDTTFTYLPQQIYNNTLHPVKNLSFIKRGDRVLEYGCSIAPYYRAYREYYNYKDANWTLADLKQISFLYSYFTYSNENAVEDMIVIDSKNMDNPLENVQGEFDVIILTTVLEHVHNPLLVIKMLLSKLKAEGILVFDYIKSDAIGLDSKAGLEGRQETLEYINKNMVVFKGKFDNLDESIGLCFARKI